MKRDRLDKLLEYALSGKDDARDASEAGLHRLRHRLAEGGGKITVLDVLLTKALGRVDAASPAAVADAGLRRLRVKLERRPSRLWAPVLKPAIAFATVAVIAAFLLISQPFAKFGPEKPKHTPGGFEGAFETRNDIIANLPNALAEPRIAEKPPKAITQERPKASLQADAMDAFANKVKGESFAKRVTAHRREILASLINDKERWQTEKTDSSSKPASSASKRDKMLNDKLNRVTEKF